MTATQRRHTRRVMIIDDHADTREGYATDLQWSGLIAVSVASAEAALAKLDDGRHCL
jgi:hypothetical protein